MLQPLRRQLAEIRDDRVLRLYGFALALANVVTFAHWELVQPIAVLLRPGAQPICWPFFESCADWRLLTTPALELLLQGWLALMIATGLAFLSRRTTGLAYAGLFLVTLVRLALMAQDFTLRANQHYMATWMTLAFLFFPGKRVLLPALLLSFYFWAGVLKLDYEWLSGAALYRREKLWVPDAFVAASCVYVAVLELLLVFGIYARRAWIFWITVAQLLVFHVWSWPIVGFWYPLLMFCLLAIVPFVRVLGGEVLRWREMLEPGLRGPAALLLGSFVFLQALPLFFPGDSAITGEGRLFALNMFDALVVCEGKMTMQPSGKEKSLAMTSRRYARRIACDPVLYFGLAKNECRRLAGHGRRDRDFDLELRSKRTSDTDFRRVIDVKGFCAAGLSYDMWRPNAWISASGSVSPGSGSISPGSGSISPGSGSISQR